MRPTLARTPDSNERREEIQRAQLRLLAANASLGACVTIIAAPILGLLEWAFVTHSLIIEWWVYMGLVSLGRYFVARRYSSTATREGGSWVIRFAVVAGMSGTGWGAAGVLLYPE